MRGQLNRLAAQRIEQEDLRAGFGVTAPFRQKSQSTRVGRPARRIVALRVRGQTNGLPQLVDHPDVGIEPVVLAVPRADDERDAARVRRHLGVAGAVERDDVIWSHRALRLRVRGDQKEELDKKDKEKSAHIVLLRALYAGGL